MCSFLKGGLWDREQVWTIHKRRPWIGLEYDFTIVNLTTKAKLQAIKFIAWGTSPFEACCDK